MKVIRIVGFSMLIGVFELLITRLSEGANFHLTTEKCILFVIIAIFSGVIIELLKEAFLDLHFYKESINLQATKFSDLEQIIERYHRIIPNFEKIREARDRVIEKKYRPFVNNLIQESSVERIWLIPKYENHEFYDTLIESLDLCDNWCGIHQGSIKLLHEDNQVHQRNAYLDALEEFANKPGKTARRIIIVDDKDEYETLKDPTSENVIRYKKNEGKVESYYILLENLKSILGKEDLKDAALLDKVIFLQYDRDKLLLDFECGDGAEKAKVVKDIFAKLDKNIKDKNLPFKFKRVGTNSLL